MKLESEFRRMAIGGIMKVSVIAALFIFTLIATATSDTKFFGDCEWLGDPGCVFEKY